MAYIHKWNMKFVFVFTRGKIIEQSIIWATKRDRHQQLSFTELCNVQVSTGSKKNRDQAVEYSKVVFQQSLNMSHVHFFGPSSKYYSQIVTKKGKKLEECGPTQVYGRGRAWLLHDNCDPTSSNCDSIRPWLSRDHLRIYTCELFHLPIVDCRRIIMDKSLFLTWNWSINLNQE